MIPLGTQQH